MNDPKEVAARLEQEARVVIKAKAALILLVSASGFAYGQVQIESSMDRAQITSSINEISRAYVARDPAPFERLYLEGHIAVRGRPVFNLREQLIAMTQADSVVLQAGKRPEYETIRFDSKSHQIYVYGRVAIVIAAKEHFWQYRGQRCLTRSQGTELWVRPADEWKFAASHADTFDCDPKPYHPIHPSVAGLQSKNRPPARSDLEGESHVREIIRSIVAARASLEESLETVLNRHVADQFVSTSGDGVVSRVRSVLGLIQVPLPSRSSVFRSPTDVVAIYGDGAVYTFRVRSSSGPAAAAPQQISIFFAKLDGRWMIVGAHMSKDSD